MEKRTELEELGEFGLIERLTSKIKLNNPSTILGVGDDAALLNYKDKLVVVSTDALVEGIHFDLTYTPLKHLGYKCCIVNFSDIFAMNAFPKQITITISASNRFSVEAIEELYSGIYLACQEYGVDIIGGDTTSSTSGLFISISVIGEVESDKVVKRSGAKQHNLICLSGDIGAAYAGLLVLEREKATFKANPNFQPDFSSYEYVLERQLKPKAQKEIISWLNKNNILPTSMIDLSDGLASEILHICRKSDVGCEIYLEKLPIDYQTNRTFEEMKINPDVGALNGGEDYELLFTIDQKDYEKIKENKDISIIGHITDKTMGENLITPQNTAITIRAQGWNHYKKEENKDE
ncbi:MAG: thiamine-phosphate kinase [Bacteroidales bacterium]|jgi:thiamine-monophosphate kinase|nr:thiamine-phosphate kinase [Bacteroidales bacterium]